MDSCLFFQYCPKPHHTRTATKLNRKVIRAHTTTLTCGGSLPFAGIEFCDERRVLGAGCGGAAPAFCGSDDDCAIIVAVVVVNLV